MRTIRWIDFEKKNTNTKEAFEKMCTHLFCRMNNISNSQIIQDFNQPGLETYPVNIDGKNIGFQSKYCSESTLFYKQAYESVCTALKLYPNLSKIILFTQLRLSSIKRINSARTKIVKKAQEYNCEIEFFCNVRFELELSKYTDIYDFFFSDEKIEKMFIDSISLEDRNFLQSKSFFNLKLGGKSYSEIEETFFNRGIYLIEGKAGTGKTEILKKFFSYTKKNIMNIKMVTPHLIIPEM